MTPPEKHDSFESLPPDERVLQIRGQIDAEESIAQAKKMVVRLLVGGLILGVASSIVVIRLIAWLDRTFDTHLSPEEAQQYHQNR